MNVIKNADCKPLLLLFTGAGFSAHAGAPVMKSFLARAFRQLPDDLLRCIRAGFYFTQYAMREEPNLEIAFGAMVFREVLHGGHFKVATLVRTDGRDEFVNSEDGPTVAQVIDGFERGIASLYGPHVLDDRQRWVGDYSRFFRYLLERFRLGVVTTNYDLVTETALGNLERRSSYVYRDTSASDDTVPILKLHGSVNWPKGPNVDLGNVHTDAPPLELARVLPPTWTKDLNEDREFASVWREAVDLIGMAEAVLVIGQSFPPTDLHLDYLFGEALSRRRGQPRAKRVTVADPDTCTASRVCERFRRYQTAGYAAAHSVCFEQLLDKIQTGGISL